MSEWELIEDPYPAKGAMFYPNEGGIVYQGKVYYPADYLPREPVPEIPGFEGTREALKGLTVRRGGGEA